MKTNNINKALGEKIRSLRELQGESQESFAYKAGVHRTYIGAVERGEKRITINTAERIAEALGVTLSELFDGL